jgi:hypothetical protein
MTHPLALTKKLDTPETPDYRLTLALGLQMILFYGSSVGLQVET